MTRMPANGAGERVSLGAAGARAARVLLAAGLLALAAGLGLGIGERDHLARFLHSYLVSFCFVLSISLGAFFFVAVHHVSRAGWSVAVRRIGELLAANMALMALLFLPLLAPVVLGQHILYAWGNPALVQPGGEQFRELIAHKRPWLNVPFFALRGLAYLAAWWLLTRYYLRRSVEQDASGDVSLTLRMERWSGPALILFGWTVTFAAFDWLMSLEAEWSSTIFGLHFFAGCVVGGLSAIVLAAVFLQATGRAARSITAEHYHDLGKWMLAFVIFWGYMAFSQYLLIWYANIPEETVWYLKRQTGGWLYVTLALLFGHLVIPFFGLMSREVKRRRRWLAAGAVWLLAFHWLDLYWLVMPSLARGSPPFGWMDVCLAAGMLSLFVASVLRGAGGKALVPQKDPRLAESLAFENV